MLGPYHVAPQTAREATGAPEAGPGLTHAALLGLRDIPADREGYRCPSAISAIISG
jgi:hypothetical protein